MVVSVHNAEHYLQECLRSLLNQSLRRLEVIAVDDGSTDGSVQILHQVAASDRRLKVVLSHQRGASVARNLGVSRARGAYLTFVQAHDTIPRTAFSRMVGSLQRSGSDFVVGGVQRVRNGSGTRPAWVTTVHQFDRIATTVDEFPLAMHDLALFNRVYRTSFWTDAVMSLPEQSDYAALLSNVTAYLRASSFDVLRAVTYLWHVRSDHASIVQERYDRQTLDERLPVLKAAWEIVSTGSSATVAGAWLGGVLDAELGLYLEYAGTGDEAYRELLQETARHFYELATPAAWEHVRVDRRLRVWLAVQGRWAALETCIEYFRLSGVVPPTRVVDGRVLADVPFRDVLGDVPTVCLELAASQTSLTACIEKCFWEPDGRLRVEGWAFIRGIDLRSTTPTLTASLVEPVTGRRVDLTLEPIHVPQASRWLNQPNQSYDTSGFRLRIDPADLPTVDPADEVRRWFLELDNTTLGVHRHDRAHAVIRSGIALRMRARDLTGADDPVRVVPVMDLDEGFAVQVRPDRVRATRLVSGAQGRVSGTLKIMNPIAVPVVAVRVARNDAQVEVPVTQLGGGLLGFELDLPPGEGTQRRWNVRALGEDGRRYRVSWPDEGSAGRRVTSTDGSLSWLRSPRAFAEIITDPRSLQATSLVLTADLLSVEVETVGLPALDLRRARLTGPASSVGVLDVIELGAGAFRLDFPTRTQIWGAADFPLPTGIHTITLDNLVCGTTDAFLEHCPIFGRTESHGYTVARSAGRDRLTINLRAPLSDDERGRYAQTRLSSWYQTADFTPRDAVLFQCYRGEFSTDSQREIHEELRRRGSGLTLLWAVSTLSVPLPEGAVPLLIGSRAWYEAVGSARYLCQNIDYDRFFRKRPHQKYLQTFHGYPWKSMGVSLWRAQGKSESMIAAECVRRTSSWDSIIVPAPFCEELYRREYRYPHEVLVTGYPRDDALVISDAEAVRTEVLERLGIPTTKKVVLYAPTWRDTVATGAWTAQMFDELDLDQLTAALGDDYALLLRGHNYNLRGGSTGSTASVLDVSSYPEINELILASDVAILDYSSLRFDWMLTNKPVLFFVPDLADYLSARTVLFEYAPTAPGPLLHSTEEVLAALRNLDEISAGYAADRERFNFEYQGLHDGHATERVVDRFFGADAGAKGDRATSIH